MKASASLCTILLILLICRTSESFACDPNEECHRCLASAFGHCIQSGNDPVCEARKAACRIAPPVVNTPGSPFGPGGPLAPGGPIPMQTVQACISDIKSCPEAILSRVGYEILRPIADQYVAFLQSQVRTWYRLDDETISEIQRFYPDINLSTVRFATQINTIHGAPITVGSEIFFPDDIDVTDTDDAHTLYHEIQHTVQYARRGGVDPFLTEYVLKAADQILSQRSFNIHDDIDLEREAINKSNEVTAGVAYGWDILLTNRCRFPISVAVLYRMTDGEWTSKGYWTFQPNQSLYAADNGKLHTRNRIFGVFARLEGADYTWSGDLPWDLNGARLNFRKVDQSAGSRNELTFSFGCDNYKQ